MALLAGKAVQLSAVSSLSRVALSFGRTGLTVSVLPGLGELYSLRNQAAQQQRLAWRGLCTQAWRGLCTQAANSTLLNAKKHVAVRASATLPSSGWWQRLGHLALAYKQLGKARLSALVVCTTAAGYIAGSGEQIQWQGLCWTAAGTMACAMSANALNQVYEVANDAVMRRTMRRPLPLGLITCGHALGFAGVLGVTGITVLATKANVLTAGLGGANIALYAGVYTPLKVVTAANTWVGALVGAIPPLMGWAAAAGRLEPGAGVLATGLYFWQLPHFLALAWLCRADYARGGYRMLSLADATGRRTAACALRNCLYLLPVGVAATALGVASPAFAVEAAILTGGMAMCAAAFWATPSQAGARLLFRASLLHLPAFCAALLLHRLPNRHEAPTHSQVLARLRIDAPRGVCKSRLQGTPAAAQQPGVWAGMLAAPFPFLPVPSLPLRCPSKAHCEAMPPPCTPAGGCGGDAKAEQGSLSASRQALLGSPVLPLRQPVAGLNQFQRQEEKEVTYN